MVKRIYDFGRAPAKRNYTVADVCGEDSEEETPPRHAYAFGNLARLHKQVYEERVAALKQFHDETRAGNFPYEAQEHRDASRRARKVPRGARQRTGGLRRAPIASTA